MHPSPSRRLRIVIVDDHPVVRKGLAEIINEQSDMTVCGQSDTASAGLERIRVERPDVAIVDMSLGADSGLRLVKEVNALVPEVRVLVLSMHDEKLHAERALAAGAHGYVMKDQAANFLIAAIHCVASGKTYLSQQMSERIVTRMTSRGDTRKQGTPFENLTDRERQVFDLIGRGLATRVIASQLELSVKTVETYQARIKEKLGLANTNELIRAAVSWTQL